MNRNYISKKQKTKKQLISNSDSSHSLLLVKCRISRREGKMEKATRSKPAREPVGI